MKTMYLDCSMGAAGDMLTAALYELLPQTDRAGFLRELDSLGLPGVEFEAVPDAKCGITGTRFTVKTDGGECGAQHGRHSGLREVENLAGHLALPEDVRQDIVEVYELIAQAESRIHGVPVEEAHFYEAGDMVTIACVAAACLLMYRLASEQVMASPVHVGCGQVGRTSGVLPVPAPATAHLLRGIPIYGGSIQGELCTPTGAALLKHFVSSFGPMPLMTVGSVGYGMGKDDFEAANCLRAMFGEGAEV